MQGYHIRLGLGLFSLWTVCKGLRRVLFTFSQHFVCAPWHEIAFILCFHRSRKQYFHSWILTVLCYQYNQTIPLHSIYNLYFHDCLWIADSRSWTSGSYFWLSCFFTCLLINIFWWIALKNFHILLKKNGLLLILHRYGFYDSPSSIQLVAIYESEGHSCNPSLKPSE